jgi:exodeoxyribonuclease VII small subunit
MELNQNSDSYETNFQHLQQVVEKLEKDGLGLEESLALFEQGMLLASRCDHQLHLVEERVRVLVSGSESLSTRAEIPLEPLPIDDHLENEHDEPSKAELP